MPALQSDGSSVELVRPSYYLNLIYRQRLLHIVCYNEPTWLYQNATTSLAPTTGQRLRITKCAENSLASCNKEPMQRRTGHLAQHQLGQKPVFFQPTSMAEFESPLESLQSQVNAAINGSKIIPQKKPDRISAGEFGEVFVKIFHLGVSNVNIQKKTSMPRVQIKFLTQLFWVRRAVRCATSHTSVNIVRIIFSMEIFERQICKLIGYVYNPSSSYHFKIYMTDRNSVTGFTYNLYDTSHV